MLPESDVQESFDVDMKIEIGSVSEKRVITKKETIHNGRAHRYTLEKASDAEKSKSPKKKA